MTKVCILLGANENDAKIQMENIIAFEMELAKISTPFEDRRNEEAMYHSMKLWELEKLAPFLNWTEHFDDAMKLINGHITQNEVVVVYASDFLKNLSKIINNMQNTNEGKM
ncbi:neprilysin-3-like [Teleopsis dalmanni]|uniref:neprilysin-3-like n=1 Tax=Teleopsis dalmanni TaxID=139649 RepID=UPI0018CE54A8|nr:neprilysin-3-like [Teleopsis dalmanni]